MRRGRGSLCHRYRHLEYRIALAVRTAFMMGRGSVVGEKSRGWWRRRWKGCPADFSAGGARMRIFPDADRRRPRFKKFSDAGLLTSASHKPDDGECCRLRGDVIIAEPALIGFAGSASSNRQSNRNCLLLQAPIPIGKGFC